MEDERASSFSTLFKREVTIVKGVLLRNQAFVVKMRKRTDEEKTLVADLCKEHLHFGVHKFVRLI